MLTLKLAFRNLFRNTRRTVLTVMLIGFSLAALIITDAVVIGMTKVITDSVTQTLNGEAQVHRQGFLESFDTELLLESSRTIEAIIDSDAAVAAHAPRVMSGGMVSSSYNVTGGLIYGVDADRELKVSKINEAIIEGHYLTGAGGEILIGKSMAQLLEVELGDRIVLTLAEAESGDLAQALFRVSGLFEFGMREIDDTFVFINLDKGREILGLTDESHQIIIRFKDPGDATDKTLPLYRKLNQGEVEALSWIEANREIAAMLGMSGYSSIIVGTILFLLASLGVINSMFMSIYERIYEIGVIKALGTKPTQLILLVASEAGLIALVSCMFGMALGGALGLWFGEHGIPLGEIELSGISLDNTIKTVLVPDQFIDFPIYVVVLTIVAALYPARFASKITPATALQRSL